VLVVWHTVFIAEVVEVGLQAVQHERVIASFQQQLSAVAIVTVAAVHHAGL
jgi:hypothetical protein